MRPDHQAGANGYLTTSRARAVGAQEPSASSLLFSQSSAMAAAFSVPRGGSPTENSTLAEHHLDSMGEITRFLPAECSVALVKEKAAAR